MDCVVTNIRFLLTLEATSSNDEVQDKLPESPKNVYINVYTLLTANVLTIGLDISFSSLK